jgi:L-ascorbate metabolism protein UlaG (beta-lactamase superfamily)
VRGRKLPLAGIGADLMIITTALLTACASAPPTPPDFDEAAWLADVKATDIANLYAPHYNEKEKTFFNPWMPRSERRQSGGRRRSWFNRKKPEYPPWPSELYIWKENDYSYLSKPDFDSISFIDHSSFAIKMNRETIITDPFYSKKAVIRSKEVKLKFNYSIVPNRPVILISHNHYDHLDKKSLKSLIKKNAVFLVPLKLKPYIEGWGAKEVYELDWWESITLGSISYTLLPAQHWSMRAAPGQGNSKTLWGGWLIQGAKTVYYSGDTGYFRGFEEFGTKYEIDCALMGAGAYEPRWFMHYQHMNPDEFIRAADDLNAKISIPMHFGTISLSDEPLNYPLYALDEFIKNNPDYARKIKLLRIGEYLELNAIPNEIQNE